MWYIDAWAVLDGVAFVSDRDIDQINSRSTVFLSVPDLEPVPVGRISTALRATRAGFQEGFRDTELHEEIGFETLDQVREVIRRGYLGGGLGPATPAPPPEEPEPEGNEPGSAFPEGPPFDGGEYYEGRLLDLGRQGDAWLDYSQLCYEGSRNEVFIALIQGGGVESLYLYLRAFGEATLVEFVSRNRRTLHDSAQMGFLVRWAGFLYSLGLWHGPDGFADFLTTAGIDSVSRDVLRESIYFPSYSWGSWSDRTSPLAAESLLFQLPCPLRRHWSRHIEKLGQKLLLPLIDRQYFASNPELPEFIPLLLCAMTIVSDQPLIHRRIPMGRNADRRRLIARAFLWISRELPGLLLPWQAENLLSDYAWRRLEGPSEEQVTAG